jgi:MFS transporter, DHA1 family, inner membrane transport protein
MQSEYTKTTIRKPSITAQAILFGLTRMVVNTNTRMYYPFLAVFARGLGIDIAQISIAMSARALVGVLNPFLAAVVDQRGHKSGLLYGLGIFIVANFMIVIWPTYPVFFLSVILAMLGAFLVIFSIQAYIGDTVPYQQRGRVLAITEMGWSLSFILLIPLVGFLISRSGWIGPFPLLAGMGIAAFILIARLLPPDPARPVVISGIAQNIRIVLTSGPALAAIGMGFLFTMANEVVNLMFGVWMEDSFGLQIMALGAASAVIGISELGGEGLTAVLVDRLGKERSILVGLILNGLSAIALPILGTSVAGGLVGLFLFYLTFEFTVVSSLPLLTEILPSTRATLMGMNIAAFSLGRALGAIMAPQLYLSGFWLNAAAALVFDLLAIFFLSRIRLSRQDERPLLGRN